jgi:hypothetical protein
MNTALYSGLEYVQTGMRPRYQSYSGAYYPTDAGLGMMEASRCRGRDTSTNGHDGPHDGSRSGCLRGFRGIEAPPGFPMRCSRSFPVRWWPLNEGLLDLVGEDQ